jgi:hypothetical protein
MKTLKDYVLELHSEGKSAREILEYLQKNKIKNQRGLDPTVGSIYSHISEAGLSKKKIKKPKMITLVNDDVTTTSSSKVFCFYGSSEEIINIIRKIA